VKPFAAVAIVVALAGVTAGAQAKKPTLAAPNAAGVSMGHLHYRVRDVAANRRFWISLGGQPVTGPTRFAAPGREILRFQDVLVVLDPGETTGGTEGSVVNHVAFRVPSLAPVEAAGLMPARLAQFPGVSSVMSPENERIELFENIATNLTFTPDGGGALDAVADRHNHPLSVPVAFFHVHLYLPDATAVGEAKAWYSRLFGGIPGKRSQYDASDVPGINLNFSVAPRAGRSSDLPQAGTAGTRGRMLDHVGFEVVRLKEFCRRLEGMGVKFDEPFTAGRDGVSRARFTDPWGTSIELTEGLSGL
jgi:catechol 2,3-dioxygenase-like lactoylglutathione lyase family enzyme